MDKIYGIIGIVACISAFIAIACGLGYWIFTKLR